MARKAAAGLVVIVLAAGAWYALRRPAGVRVAVDANRNVLLVSIDTLRADALGSYGGRAQTPNLDRLAAAGARFTFAHAHAVVTLVSHASIFSGRYPYEHGVRDNTGYRFPAATPTMASLLKTQGFATGAFVGGFPLDRQFGLATGFDVYDDALGRAAAATDPGDRERRADDVVASAVSWIDRQRAKWFGFVHVYDPHAPYQAPADWASRFPADPYLGEVSYTDHALGALLDRLSRESRPTLVIVTADHGESLGDHGELTHSLFAYESTLRVPLIVAVVDPTATAAPHGTTIDTPVRHVDLLPTMLEAAGAPLPAALPGASLLGVIANGGGDDRPSYFEAMSAAIVRGWAPLRGVVAGREKYIDLPIPELYDLAADAAEARNLAADRLERARTLHARLAQFNLDPPGRAKQESPETIERLRSLGYVAGGTGAPRERYTDADDPKRLVALEQTMTKAAEAYREGRAAAAIDMYKSVIAARRDTEDAYRKLALIYWRAGQPRNAVAVLEDALRNGVTQTEVRIKLSQYLAESGEAAKAIALLEHDAEGDPDALLTLGNAYLIAGKADAAGRTFRRVLELDPKSGLAHQNLGTIALQAKRYAEAETELRHALALDPALAGAYTALGVVFASTGRSAEAVDAWQKALAIDPTDSNARDNLARFRR